MLALDSPYSGARGKAGKVRPVPVSGLCVCGGLLLHKLWVVLSTPGSARVPQTGLQPAAVSSDCSGLYLVVAPGGAKLPQEAGTSQEAPHLAGSLLPSQAICDSGAHPIASCDL